MKEVGTLKELDVKPGDVVEYIHGNARYTIAEDKCLVFPDGKTLRYWQWDTCSNFRLISRASDKPKLWRDMNDAEKGALLLAEHEGKVIEVYDNGNWVKRSFLAWAQGNAYRVRPEPKVETVTLEGANYMYEWEFDEHNDVSATHRITFNTNNGKPDCASIKMESL